MCRNQSHTIVLSHSRPYPAGNWSLKRSEKVTSDTREMYSAGAVLFMLAHHTEMAVRGCEGGQRVQTPG